MVSVPSASFQVRLSPQVPDVSIAVGRRAPPSVLHSRFPGVLLFQRVSAYLRFLSFGRFVHLGFLSFGGFSRLGFFRFDGFTFDRFTAVFRLHNLSRFPFTAQLHRQHIRPAGHLGTWPAPEAGRVNRFLRLHFFLLLSLLWFTPSSSIVTQSQHDSNQFPFFSLLSIYFSPSPIVK